MLELKNVNIHLQSDGRSLIENFSFTLNNGDKAVIIGEEGNGKSTLLKFIYDRKLIEGYCDCSGSVIIKKRLAYLPQTMDEKLHNLSLEAYFSKANLYAHMEMLTKLNLPYDFVNSSQKLATLSGGEKVKVQLMRLLMDDPDVLLLDEPTNDLDIQTLEWLEQFIKRTKIPILFISHDETLIENTANVIVHMEQISRKTKCRITVTHASYKEYLAFRRSSFNKQDQVAQKQRDDYDRQMDKWRQIYNRVDHEQEIISRQDPAGARLLKKKMHSVLSMGRRFEREKESFTDFPQEEFAILTKFDDTISVPRGKVILDYQLPKLSIGAKELANNVYLHVVGSEHIDITGANGSGKSTYLDILWEQLKDRKDIVPCYMPQHYAARLNYHQTPLEHLAAHYTKEDITRARTYMGSMKFTHEEMMGKIGQLSAGQKAKILFLEMVLQKANVLLLDEPTRNFSPLSTPVVRNSLKNFGGAIISVSHDRKYLKEVCDTVYELTLNGLRLEI